MTIDTAIHSPEPAAKSDAGVSSFDAARRKADATLRTVADQVVGSVFYGTLLRQLRASTLQGPYGHGGHGEQVFQAQLDQTLAEQAGQARTFDLSAALVRDLVKQQTHMNLAAEQNTHTGSETA
ncbi:MAG: hypothetical protein JXB13_04105 [Phycisphaerae bacterium]|nr:hypothetical protein [Phycisphaerae bacterium]